MKKILLSAMICLAASTMSAQVEFSKFKLIKNEPLGMFPGRKGLETKFKITSERPLKYVYIDYYLVNAVGDVISGLSSGVLDSEKEEYTKPKQMQCTGPFEPKKSYSPWLTSVITTGQKVTAFPHQIQIMYAGENEMVKIPITKDNIKQYFPKVEWMEINRYNPAL